MIGSLREEQPMAVAGEDITAEQNARTAPDVQNVVPEFFDLQVRSYRDRGDNRLCESVFGPFVVLWGPFSPNDLYSADRDSLHTCTLIDF